MKLRPPLSLSASQVQTNFSVVAYTRSELHIAMLSLFVDIRCRLPNAVMGHITRDVVKRSFRKRIGARAIQTFLECHALLLQAGPRARQPHVSTGLREPELEVLLAPVHVPRIHLRRR